MSGISNKEPLISIVVGVRNMENTIEKCLNSIIAQTYKNKEIFVINDGSEDNTLNILLKIKEENTNIPITIKTTSKLGISHARNLGYEVANGEFIAYTDADCVIVENWLELVIPYFDDPDVGLVGGVTKFRSDNSYSSIYRQVEFDKRYKNVKKREVVWAGGPGSIFRKSVLEEVGGFNPNWIHGEDAEISFLIFEMNYKIIKEDRALTYHVPEKKIRNLVYKGYRDGKAYVRATFFHPSTSLKNKFNTSWYVPYDMVFQPILYAILILLAPLILFLWILDMTYLSNIWKLVFLFLWPQKAPNVLRICIYLFSIILSFLLIYSLIPSLHVAKRTPEHKVKFFFETIVLHFFRGLAWGLSLIIGLLYALKYQFLSLKKLDDYKLLDIKYYRIKPIEKEIENYDFSEVQDAKTDLISIIIVSYNNEATIVPVLNSISNAIGIDYEIILIDNNSQDRTVDLVRNYKNSKLKKYFLHTNLGFSGGNNYGAKKAKGKYILFLNPDALVEENTIYGLYLAYQKLKTKYKKLILSPKIDVLAKGQRVFKIGTINSMGFAYFDRLDGYKENKIQRTDFVSGCCMFLELQSFRELKYFNSRYFMYYEDVEFSIRARVNGYKLFVLNLFSVMHLKTDIDYKLSKLKYYYVERNRINTIFQYNSKKRTNFIKFLLFEPILIFHALINRLLRTRSSIYSYFLRNGGIETSHNRDRKILISKRARIKDLFFFSGLKAKYEFFLILLENYLKILNNA